MQVNTNGFGDINNERIAGMAVFNGNLYVGTQNETTGGEIWRYNGTAWVQVNTDGFGDANNVSAQELSVYNGYLYVGTDNLITGCEVWRSAAAGGPPFTDWVQVNTDAFGDANNVEAEDLKTYNGYLYVATSREVWRTGTLGGPPFTDWEQIDNGWGGDPNNTHTSVLEVYNGSLYVGADNSNTGCEVWEYQENNGVPTISEWGMIVFFILLVVSALWVIRKRTGQKSV